MNKVQGADLPEPFQLLDSDLENDDSKDQKQIYYTLTLTSIQSAASFLLEQIPNLITIIFLGRIGREDLIAGFGLGMSWVHCFGIGFLAGLACGVETMVSHAFGAGSLKLCGGIYNRAITISVFMMIPIFFFQFYAANILSSFNNNQQLVQDAGITTSTMIPAIFLNGIYETTKNFLNGQNIYNSLLLLFMCCGATYSSSIINWGQSVHPYPDLQLKFLAIQFYGCSFWYFLINHIKRTKCSQNVLVSYDKQYLTQWWPFLKIALPIGSLLWLEWVCFEMYAIQASFLTSVEFASNVIMANFGSFFYQFSYGISVAATTYVGSEMGKKDQVQAKKFALASCILTGLFLLFTQVPLFYLSQPFGKIFTSDPNIQKQLLSSHIYLQIFLILDSFQAVITGLARGIGRENFAAISFTFFYLVVGQIISYLLCFQFGLSLNGIWIGLNIGALGYNILQIINLVLSNWSDLVQQIQDKINSQDHPEELKVIEDKSMMF